MKSFLQYLVESKKRYQYRIRTIVPVTSDDILKIKSVLEKYGILDITKPKQTILQDSPLDFPEIKMGEVYIMDITTEVPLSPEILLQELRGALNIVWGQIVVRGLNDPMELETEIQNDNSGLIPGAPLLSNNPEYKEYDISVDEPQSFGDDYNKRFLAYLAKVASERKEIESVVQPENQEKKMFGLMSELNNSSEDFNKDYDTPKPVPTNQANPSSPLPVDLSNEGSFISSKRKTLKK